MDFINEYALLFAVALPVVAIVGIQVFLFISGERGTLLVPGLNRYPSIEFQSKSAEVVMKPTPMPASRAAVATESSNDEMVREAA
jgi:hypothetical protein